MIVDEINRLRESPNFRHGAFQNLSPTPLMGKQGSYAKALMASLNRPKTVRPSGIIPSIKSDILKGSEKPAITWFGHSSYLIQVNHKNILVDPVFSGHAAPFSWLIRAFPGTDIYSTDDFPEIDLLVITHNHYDHLDLHTFQALRPKIRMICTALGEGKYFSGFDPARIKEFDWWECVQVLDGIELTALPARHFSGRGLVRNGTLWASFALKAYGFDLYVGGDSGYDGHFKEIGEKYGPFDIAMLECGQYNIMWPYIHMMPEETVQASIDLKAKVLLPVHWAKFTLANHPWDEPVKRLIKWARELGVTVTTPMVGEQVILNESYPSAEWWEGVQ